MSFDDDRAHFLSLDTETNDTGPSTLRTQHGLTRGEVVQGIASRFMYSRFYITLYVTLVVLSLLSIILSINETCPTTFFIALESIINVAMIIEVVVRVLALGRNYWNSIWNIIDLMLVLFCCITLVVITTGCSAGEREEAILDTILLVVRNVIQSFRLFGMLRRNRHTFSTRPNNIDFSGVASESRRDLRGTSIDFSAFDPHSGRGGVGLMDESEEEEEEFV